MVAKGIDCLTYFSVYILNLGYFKKIANLRFFHCLQQYSSLFQQYCLCFASGYSFLCTPAVFDITMRVLGSCGFATV